MIVEFSDTDYAVIVDSLAANRDVIRAKGIETPNVDSALAKLGKWASPSGCQFVVVTGEDSPVFGF